MKTVELAVPDMSCEHCVGTVTSALKVVEGVKDVSVTLDDKKARVRAEDELGEEKLLDAVRQVGYTPELTSS